MGLQVLYPSNEAGKAEVLKAEVLKAEYALPLPTPITITIYHGS
jgi:hypothetical protein